ncbi:putative DHHC zinc finger protein [Blattamonas nauphoetae]|uniref:Palmitoyltransferase n=1 Tax=Blattamonas nauphoetae TaxID=2049346 RepID=A0ABQ9WZZ9_9EUKA|nr:putative DHHC zinc finger protein [Blattamonas nauphoetae]
MLSNSQQHSVATCPEMAPCLAGCCDVPTMPMNRHRDNGFTAPLAGPQIFAWILLPVQFILSCVFIYGGTPILSFIISTSATAIVFLIAFFLLFYVARTNPADPFLHLPDSEDDSTPQELKDLPKSFCGMCSKVVLQSSRHCRRCNKCISGFDHHCPWVNNCIGKSNYKPFFTLLVMVVLQFLFSAGMCIYNVIYVWVQHLLSPALSFFRNQQILLTIMDIVMIVIDIAGLYIIGDLLRFHIMLQIRRETTFQYIMRKKAETEEKKKNKELKLKREEERKRAKVGAKQIVPTVSETELTQIITEPDVQPSTKTSRSTTMSGIASQPFANEYDENEQPMAGSPTVATESDADDHEWELSADGSRADKDERQNSNMTTLAMTFIRKEGEVENIQQFSSLTSRSNRKNSAASRGSNIFNEALSNTVTSIDHFQAAILTDRTKARARTRPNSAVDGPLLSMTYTQGMKVRQAQTTNDNDVGPSRNQIDLSASMPPVTNTTQISTLYPSQFPFQMHSGPSPSTITVGGGAQKINKLNRTVQIASPQIKRKKADQDLDSTIGHVPWTTTADSG